MDTAEAGDYPLISTTGNPGVVSTELADALKAHGAQCTTTSWTQDADHVVAAEQLRSQLEGGGFTGVVVVAADDEGSPENQDAIIGGGYVRHLVRIARELPELSGEAPRLYVVTRDAQPVQSEDCANLEQGGLRGLLRVIGSEHPHLRTTHIDLDGQTDAEQLARQLSSGSDERTRPLGATTSGTSLGRARPRCVPRSGAPRSSISKTTVRVANPHTR